MLVKKQGKKIRDKTAKNIFLHSFFFFFFLLTCSDLSVCSKYMLYFFQSAVNKAVNIVLSIAKDIPLWKFAYLHHKQQKVSILF